MHKIFSCFSFLFICSLFLSAPGHAASIKARMIERIPAITILKNQGTVGENNVGFLEFRSTSKPQQHLISAENRDRNIVYTAIGKQQGVSSTLVGQRRAKQIAKAGKAGQWFQKADGSWYKK